MDDIAAGLFNETAGPDDPLGRALAAARAGAGALPDPRSYHVGAQAGDLVRPDNVLLFTRTAPLGHAGSLHHRHVLILNLATAGTVIVDRVWCPLEPGWALLVLPYQFHHYARFAGEELCWLFITFELAEEAAALARLRETPVRLSARAMTYASQCCTLHRAAQQGSEAAGQELVLMTAALLHALLAARPVRPTLPRGDQAARALVQAVGRYLEQHADEPTQVADLADHLAMSESHLRNRFKAATGTSVGRYVRQFKLVRATWLLDTTDLTVTQVSEACGFGSLYAFSRTFRQAIGMSPQGYRRRGGPRG